MAGDQAVEDRRSEYIRLDDSAEVGRFATVRTVLRLLGLLRSYKRRAAVAMAIDVVHIFSLVAIPWVIRLLIDDYVTEGRPVLDMVRPLALLAGLALVQYVSQRASSLMLATLGHRLLYDMRSAIFDRLLRLSMTFYDRNQVGRVMSRAQNDVQQVQGVMNIGWLAISETFILAGVAVGMLAMDLRLGVLSLFTVVLIFPVVIFWQKFARAAYVRARQTMADVNTKLQENLTAIRVVQSLGREKANLQSFDEANRESEKASIEATKFGAALMPSVEALNAIGLALVISIGGMLALGRLHRGGCAGGLHAVHHPVLRAGREADLPVQRSAARHRLHLAHLRGHGHSTAVAGQTRRDGAAAREGRDSVRGGRLPLLRGPGRCCAASTCGSRPARPSRWSGRRARARRRWSPCSCASTTRRRAGSQSTAAACAT